MDELVFLKLGGSVITNKDQPNSANLDQMDAIASEIAHALKENAGLSLVIGHGSGSFGHHAAQKYGTRKGVSTPQDWRGFTEVAACARELNQIVIDRLLQAGIKAISISAFSGILAENRQIVSWDTGVLEDCLQKHLIPVVYGDVIVDIQLGGSLLSTEEIFSWLARKLQPDKILLAGLEEGIWEDFPERDHLFSEIDPRELGAQTNIQVSQSIDVTGGMRSKVEVMASLIQQIPALNIQIFSAAQPGNVYSTLMGIQKGTLLRYSKG